MYNMKEKIEENRWELCPEDEVPENIKEWVSLFKKARELGFSPKSGKLPKKVLEDFIKLNSKE